MMKRVWLPLITLFLSVFFDVSADLACLDHPAREGDTVFLGPTASSTLKEGTEPENYSTEKYGIHRAFDGSLKTAWSEGQDGPGIGVEISFAIPVPASRINIINGYAATRRLFRANNRVKDITLEIRIGVQTDVGQCNEVYTSRLLKSLPFTLADTDEEQAIDLDMAGYDLEKIMPEYQAEVFASRPDLNEVFKDYDPVLIGIITIRSVYRGERYNDTCIAEISFE